MGMRSVVFLVVAAGCGFQLGTPGGNGPGLDARSDAPSEPRIDAAFDAGFDASPDAPPDARPDAPPDAPPAWTVIETFNISCGGAAVVSTTTLLTGTTYRVRAEGQCIANSGSNSRADAEYIGYNLTVPTDIYMGVDTGIAINDASPGSLKQPRWGSYATDHVYQVPWVGAGAPITVRYHEEDVANNTGLLTFSILALQ